MSKSKLIKRLLIAGGIFEILIAVLHFLWPFNLINSPDFTNISDNIKNLMLLESLAIGLCLFIFGLLAFYFASQVYNTTKNVRIFCLSQVVLWIARLIFELFLPVKVSMYFINNPTTLILIGIPIIILLFFIPILLLKNNTQ